MRWAVGWWVVRHGRICGAEHSLRLKPTTLCITNFSQTFRRQQHEIEVQVRNTYTTL